MCFEDYGINLGELLLGTASGRFLNLGDLHDLEAPALCPCLEVQLLVSWANRASHTDDLVPPEANKLINACEEVIESFRCSSCQKTVWFTNSEASKWLQCQCGGIRWRYDRA